MPIYALALQRTNALYFFSYSVFCRVVTGSWEQFRTHQVNRRATHNIKDVWIIYNDWYAISVTARQRRWMFLKSEKSLAHALEVCMAYIFLFLLLLYMFSMDRNTFPFPHHASDCVLLFFVPTKARPITTVTFLYRKRHHGIMEISTHAQHVRFIVEIISIFCRFCLQQSHILQMGCWLMLLAGSIKLSAFIRHSYANHYQLIPWTCLVHCFMMNSILYGNNANHEW